MVAPSSALRPQPVWFVQAAGRVWGPYPPARLKSFVQEGRLTAESLVANKASGPFGPAGQRRDLYALFFAQAPSNSGGSAAGPGFGGPERAFSTRPAPEQASRSPASSQERNRDPFVSDPFAAASSRPEPGRARLPPEGPSSAVAAIAEGTGLKTGLIEPVTLPRAANDQTPPVRPATSGVDGGRSLVVWADLSSVTYLRFETLLGHYGACVPVRPGLWLVRSKLEAAGLRNGLSRRLRSDDALLVIDAPLDRAAWFNLGGAERELRQIWEGGVQS